MNHRITTFAATITIAASLLTGCASELDAPELDDTSCSHCVDTNAVPAPDDAAQAIPSHPRIDDLAMTTIHAEMFKGDWPVEEILLEAYYDGGLDEEDRAMIGEMVGGAAVGVDFALAKLTQKIDEGGVLTDAELEAIEEIEAQLGDILYPEVDAVVQLGTQ